MILIYTSSAIKNILSAFLHFKLGFEEKNKQLPSISFSLKHSHNKFIFNNKLCVAMQALQCHGLEYPH